MIGLRISAILAVLCLGTAGAGADDVTKACRNIVVSDEQKLGSSQWQPVDGSKRVYRLMAYCEASEVPVGGGFHFNRPADPEAIQEASDWRIVGSTLYAANLTYNGWQCVASYKDDNAGSNRPWQLWCAVTCCPK